MKRRLSQAEKKFSRLFIELFQSINMLEFENNQSNVSFTHHKKKNANISHAQLFSLRQKLTRLLLS